MFADPAFLGKPQNEAFLLASEGAHGKKNLHIQNLHVTLLHFIYVFYIFCCL
jgi:hypothetical protein